MQKYKIKNKIKISSNSFVSVIYIIYLKTLSLSWNYRMFLYFVLIFPATIVNLLQLAVLMFQSQAHQHAGSLILLQTQC